MDTSTQKAIADITVRVQFLTDSIKKVQDSEQDLFDLMTPSEQSSPKGDEWEDMIGNLFSAWSAMDEAISYLKQISPKNAAADDLITEH